MRRSNPSNFMDHGLLGRFWPVAGAGLLLGLAGAASAAPPELDALVARLAAHDTLYATASFAGGSTLGLHDDPFGGVGVLEIDVPSGQIVWTAAHGGARVIATPTSAVWVSDQGSVNLPDPFGQAFEDVAAAVAGGLSNVTFTAGPPPWVPEPYPSQLWFALDFPGSWSSSFQVYAAFDEVEAELRSLHIRSNDGNPLVVGGPYTSSLEVYDHRWDVVLEPSRTSTVLSGVYPLSKETQAMNPWSQGPTRALPAHERITRLPLSYAGQLVVPDLVLPGPGAPPDAQLDTSDDREGLAQEITTPCGGGGDADGAMRLRWVVDPQAETHSLAAANVSCGLRLTASFTSVLEGPASGCDQITARVLRSGLQGQVVLAEKSGLRCEPGTRSLAFEALLPGTVPLDSVVVELDVVSDATCNLASSRPLNRVARARVGEPPTLHWDHCQP